MACSKWLPCALSKARYTAFDAAKLLHTASASARFGPSYTSCTPAKSARNSSCHHEQEAYVLRYSCWRQMIEQWPGMCAFPTKIRR